MASLKTHSDIHACLAAAVAEVMEEFTVLQGTLPVATPDDIEHAAMVATFSAAMMRRAAHTRRQILKQAPAVERWWD